MTPQLGISLDGNKQMHDKNRRYKNGKGTYEDVVRHLEEIKSNTSLAKKTREFILMTVLTADNLDIDVMEEKLGGLDGFLYDEVQMSLLEQLREAVDNIDVDTCTEIVVRWEALLG